jgi:hypothetical protein
MTGHWSAWLARSLDSKHTFTPSPRDAPETLINLPPNRGRGERRMPVAPAASCALGSGRTHTSIRVPRNHPTFPHAMVLTVSFELSPVTSLVCHRRPRIKCCLSPVGPTRLRELDASVGASGPHDFAVRCNIPRPLAVDRSQVFQLALQSRRAQNAAASTASHPASVTIAIRPFVGETARVLELIWGNWEQKYFSENQKKDSTARETP